MMSTLLRDRWHSHRDWSDMTISQGTCGVTKSWEGKKGSSPTAFRRNQCCCHLNLELLTSRPWDNRFLVLSCLFAFELGQVIALRPTSPAVLYSFWLFTPAQPSSGAIAGQLWTAVQVVHWDMCCPWGTPVHSLWSCMPWPRSRTLYKSRSTKRHGQKENQAGDICNSYTQSILGPKSISWEAQLQARIKGRGPEQGRGKPHGRWS